MTDVEATQQPEVQNTDLKAEKHVSNELLNQTVETEAHSPSQPQTSTTPAKTEADPEAEAETQPLKKSTIPADPVTISKDLKKLHEKVDEVLIRHHAPIYRSQVIATTYHVNSLRNSTISHHELARTSYIPYVSHGPYSSVPYRPYDSYISNVNVPYTYVHHTPKYDQDKLDNIIGKILGVHHVTPQNVSARVAAYDRPSYKSQILTHTPTKTLARNISTTPSKPVKKATKYQCGECEADADSIILDHIKAVNNEVEQNHQNYNNFYVGSLHEDLNDEPRNKRAGSKRQQIAEARRGGDPDSEFIKKSVYDQRNNQKASNEQAKKVLAAGGAAYQDFDFARAQHKRF